MLGFGPIASMPIASSAVVYWAAPRVPLPTYDVHIRRSAMDYAQAFSDLLPTGTAWPRDPKTVLQTTLAGLSGIWGDPSTLPVPQHGVSVDGRAADLLEAESDPRATVELLPEWERAWGLPDPCIAEPISAIDRRNALVAKMTLLGGQSRAFFIGAAAAIGYAITIREFSPFMCGISRCGDTSDLNAAVSGGDLAHYRWEIGPPEIRFYWVVKPIATRLTYFHVSISQCGIDPLLRIALGTDLECLIRRWAPAHTQVIFDYSGIVGNVLYSETGQALGPEGGGILTAG